MSRISYLYARNGLWLIFLSPLKFRETEAAADIGKIVSLMAVDSQRVGMQIAGLYMSYSGKP